MGRILPDRAGAETSKKTSRNPAPAFKAKMALGAMKDDKTIAAGIAQQFEVDPALVSEHDPAVTSDRGVKCLA